MEKMEASDLYTREDLKHVLVDLVDKTKQLQLLYHVLKLIEDKDSNSELDEAVNLLLECLPDCPEAYDQALDFFAANDR